MKRLFITILFAALISVAFAQVEKSIIIDQNSFRPVHTDALTGVNIDPIAKDISRNACARVKIRFTNMNKAEIEALDIKFRSNTYLAKCKVADYFENILVLEMTAKANTRFYLFHPDFGESNEVTLNLEGDCEYEIEASLNQTFSIVINCNVSGAEVYIDGVPKGRTDSSCSLIVKEVIIGTHTLKVAYGGISYEQKIEINSGSIQFRQNVDTSLSEPQFVVFAVEPATAVVIIDNKHYTLSDGTMRVVLDSGTYNYTVTAAGYHSQSGTFTVAGAKVEKSISLKADAANITLTVADNAEIWINGEYKAISTWSGTLHSGTYIFETRKAGHKSTTISKHITSEQASQSYTLAAPTPILGSLMVDGTPLMADVAIDGKNVGRTPLKLSNILIGNHKVTVSKSGYAPYTQSVTITEGKTTTVNATLLSQTAYATHTCKIGDIITVNGVQGIVFQTIPQVKIVSVAEGLTQWSTLTNSTYAYDWADGQNNMSKIESIVNWQTDYPAFRWCSDLGEGWYLPSIRELSDIYAQRRTIDNVLRAGGMATLGLKSEDKLIYSSSEMNTHHAYKLQFDYLGHRFDSYRSANKKTEFSVRAVYAFEKNSVKKTKTSAPYKVGDYYNDGVKEGVVFQVSDDGCHGKIVSMTQSSKGIRWTYEDKKLIAAKDESDGARNMAKVCRIKDWQSKYPAFKWCKDLGDGWYLPAIRELQSLMLDAYDVVNKTLVAYGGEKLYADEDYWSSTEQLAKMQKDQYYAQARAYRKITGTIYFMGNTFAPYTVRAVATF